MRLGRILLLVALVIIVGLGGWWFLGQGGSDSGAGGDAAPVVVETIPVVFLVQPVSRGEIIPPEKIALTDLPKSNVPQVYFSDMGEVIGRIASFDLQQGTFITRSMVVENPVDLIGQNVGSDHAAMIPAGMVAFPIPINRFSGLAYGLSRGDRVNVIVTLAMADFDTQFQTILPNHTSGVVDPGVNILLANSSEAGLNMFSSDDIPFNNIVAQSYNGGPTSLAGRAEQDSILSQPFYYTPSEPQRSRLVSQTVLQNIVVLNLGNFDVSNDEGEIVQMVTPTPEGYQEGEGEVPQGPTMLPPDIITLIMWPQDAVTLNFLIYSGAELTLALRSSGDDTQALTDAVTLQYLMDVYRIPLPAKLPYGLQPGIYELEAPVLENDKPEEIIIR
ncbi:MAG: SAF domain-containing protein [Chloroflexota bacterium]